MLFIKDSIGAQHCGMSNAADKNLSPHLIDTYIGSIDINIVF